MPDAGGNIKGIATSGKAGETIERIFGKRCHWSECPHGENCVHAKPVIGDADSQHSRSCVRK